MAGAGQDIVWSPNPARAGATAMARFAAATAQYHGCDPLDYGGLLAWSISSPQEFYSALWDFTAIIGDKPTRAVAPAANLRDWRFFPGAKINYAENALREPDDRLAISAYTENTHRSLTRRELYDLVSRIVAALRARNIGPGDRIAAIVTNDIEAIAFYLASAAIGAIWASCSPDFGPAAASDRLGQIGPKLLVAVGSYAYGGKIHDIGITLEALAKIPGLEEIILLSPTAVPLARPRLTSFADFIAPHPPAPIVFHRAAFDAPMAILFSSGTTGVPKGIIQSGGGLTLQHAKELILHCDVAPGDRLFYYTTCGWMMWNWMLSGLIAGASLITFDGNPMFPNPGRLIDLIDAEQLTHFGTSAKYIDSAAKAGLKPRQTHKLTVLKAVLSTGSPLLPASFDYIYRDWKADLQLASISGGSDICGCFMGGVPVWPVRRGQLQGAMLGMDLDVFDETGNPVSAGPGELVCRSAHPSMPLGFWGDDGSRFSAAYFDKFPGVWAHGDFVEKLPEGGFIIHGRSDATLNPGGVRIGTAEIYRPLETMPEIIDAVAVGQDWDSDQRVVLFVKLAEDAALSDALVAQIKAAIRAAATPRHVPARIIAVPDIPRTRSGKVSEIAVRDTIHGRPVKNTASLANPESLVAFAGLDALKG